MNETRKLETCTTDLCKALMRLYKEVDASCQQCAHEREAMRKAADLEAERVRQTEKAAQGR